MATFEERLQKLREKQRLGPTDKFEERLKRIRGELPESEAISPILIERVARATGETQAQAKQRLIQVRATATRPEDQQESRISAFSKQIVRGIATPVVKSFLAPGQAIVSLATGDTPIDLRLPFLGDVTPPTTIRGGIGVALQTGTLGIGGGVLGTSRGLLKTAATEAVIGSAFGLGAGLEEEKRGKELILPTVLGAAFGAIAPPIAKGFTKLAIPAAQKVSREIGQKVLVPVKKSFLQLFNTTPIKAVSSVAARLKGLGEPGVKILAGFEKIDKEKLLRTGTALDNLDERGFAKLNKNESVQLLDAFEGRFVRSDLPENLKPIYDVFDNLRTEIEKEAEQLVKVRTRLSKEELKKLINVVKGKTKKEKLSSKLKAAFDELSDFEKENLELFGKRSIELPFKGRENFFPHFISSPEKLKPGKIRINKLREDVIDNAVRLGKFETRDDAIKVLDAYLEFAELEGRGGKFWIDYLVTSGQAKTREQARGLALRVFKLSRFKKFGNLEQARLLDFPFYDPDVRRAIPKYLLGSFERLETIKIFGRKAEELDKLLGKVKGIRTQQEAKFIIKSITDAIDRSPQVEQFSLFLRTLQIPKLAFAQIINVGQPVVNGVLKADFPSVAFGLSRAFQGLIPITIKGKKIAPIEFREGARFAKKAGVTLDALIREALEKAGAEGSFASNFLKLTGFSASEKFNRIVSANTGMRWLERTFNKLEKDPTNKILRDRIKELGLEPEQLLEKGIFERDLLTAGQKFTNITQFRGRAIDLPLFVKSPEGKILFQFKTFSFSQGKLLKDTFKQDIENRNYSRLLRNVVVLSTVFPLTGEVLQDIRSLLTGSKRPTKFLDRYIDSFMSAGGLGIAADLWRAAEFRGLAESLAGPTVSSATKGVESIVASIKKGEVTNSTIKWLMDQFGVLRPLKNVIFPPRQR